MRLLFTFATGAMVCLALAGHASAQSNVFFQPETGDWFTPGNWLDSLDNMVVPSADFNEVAIVSSGRTATVSSDGGISPGRVALGTEPGQVGTLEIQNNGVLDVVILDSGFGVTTGQVNVGTTGTGILRVLPGGTLSSDGPLTMGSSASTITVGDATGTGTATLAPNSAVLSATTQVYSNANFTADTTLEFTGSSVYNVEVNSFGNGLVSAADTATLGGTLNLNFTGVTPTIGNSWTVAEAGSIAGNFDSIQSSAELPFGQKLFLVTSPGGAGVQADVKLDEVLVLEVNRNSGVATITQPGGTDITLDGYFVASDTRGSLNPAGWNSFAAQGNQGANWTATANDANTIGEVKATGSTSIGSGAAVGLGSIYDPFAGAFGDAGEDLEFFYTRPSDGAVIPAIVTYTGTAVNSLILQVDPTSGETFLRNTSQTTVDIDNYFVQSESESLSAAGWDSLDNQDFEGGGTWLELLNADGSLLGEVNALGATTLTPGAALSLGNAYVGDATGTRDLDFQFLLFGEEDPIPGVVVYEPFDPNATPGDFNGDGQVDLADYTVWRDNLGAADESALNFNGDGGGVTAADYAVWKNFFGSSSPAAGVQAASLTAVPEPATWGMGLLLSLAAVAARRQRR